MDNRPEEDGAEPATDTLSPVIAERLADLMARHDVPARQQASFLADLCGLSLSQARRKLRGATWSFSEVLTVVRRFGVSLDEVFSDLLSDGVAKAAASAAPSGLPLQEAHFLTGEWGAPCQVRLGALMMGHIPDATLVSGRHRGGWLVGTPTDLAQKGVEGPFYHADQIILTPPPVRPSTRIAVLDDEAATSELLCEWFNTMGYRATPYTSAKQLLAAPLEEHDAFVIDFMLGGGDSSQALIEDIRRAMPDAPILLLTGKLRGGGASEAELATVLRTSNVRFFEKPVRPAVLAAAIESCLDQAMKKIPG